MLFTSRRSTRSPPSPEQLLAAAKHDRMQPQLVLIDQVMSQQRVYQHGAAKDQDRAARLLLQLADLPGDITGDNARPRPGRLAQRRGHHVLGPAVERMGDLVRSVGHRRPVLGEDLIGAPPQQERAGRREQLAVVAAVVSHELSR